MIIDNNHIIAEEGKVFKRKGTDEFFGNEIYLGKSYYIGGVKLEKPHDDVLEDFEEVDAPKPEEPKENAPEVYKGMKHPNRK